MVAHLAATAQTSSEFITEALTYQQSSAGGLLLLFDLPVLDNSHRGEPCAGTSGGGYREGSLGVAN